MKLNETPKKLQKIPHNQCITVRTTPEMLTRLKAEAKDTHKTLSGYLNDKIQTALRILFSLCNDEEKR